MTKNHAKAVYFLAQTQLYSQLKKIARAQNVPVKRLVNVAIERYLGDLDLKTGTLKKPRCPEEGW